MTGQSVTSSFGNTIFSPWDGRERRRMNESITHLTEEHKKHNTSLLLPLLHKYNTMDYRILHACEW
jgi:hypothetical protein